MIVRREELPPSPMAADVRRGMNVTLLSAAELTPAARVVLCIKILVATSFVLIVGASTPKWDI